MDRNTKKELLALFKRMLDEGLSSGKLGDLKPNGDGYKQVEYRITITKEERDV